jgi:hypothetical protein
MGLSYRITTKYGSPKRKMVKMNDSSDSDECIDEGDIRPFPDDLYDVYMIDEKYSYDDLIEEMSQ